MEAALAAMKSLSYTILHKSKSFHLPSDGGRTDRQPLFQSHFDEKDQFSVPGPFSQSSWKNSRRRRLELEEEEGTRSAKINDFD